MDYYQIDPDGDFSLLIRYLGTAGFVIEGGGRTLVLDPYVSRPPVLGLLKPLVPDTAVIDEVIPHADDVLIGHSHFDHILDAPYLCARSGARLIGSSSTRQVGLAAGLPDSQMVATAGNEVIESGSAKITGLPSRHGKMWGRIPLPGEITSPPSWPPNYKDLLCGLVLNWYIEIAGLKVMHIDSADFIDEELKERNVDILCLCAIGRKHRPDYAKTAIELLQPKYVIPCHWDWLFTPYRAAARKFPFLDLLGFIDEIEAAGAESILLPIDGEFGV